MTSKYSSLKIGVLALQGDYEHLHQLKQLGIDGQEIRLAKHLEDIDGLILPGGESTTMNKLIDRFEMREPLKLFVRSKPVWGTCAGMVMLANRIVDNLAEVETLKAIDIDVTRNGYGRQVYSFEADLKARLNRQGNSVNMKVAFIRAPKVIRRGDSVISLAKYADSDVLVSEGKILASSFHTELYEDTTLLEYFLDKFVLH